MDELFKIAEENNIPIIYSDFNKIESAAVCDEGGNCLIGINTRKVRTRRDEKVRLAHELGHCMTGTFYTRKTAYELMSRYEYRADKWAIVQVIPREELRQMLNSDAEIWQICDRYNVDESFVKKALWIYFDIS